MAKLVIEIDLGPLEDMNDDEKFLKATDVLRALTKIGNIFTDGVSDLETACGGVRDTNGNKFATYETKEA